MFAAAVRERARAAWQALQEARLGDDVHAVLEAEAEWDDARRLAETHGVRLEQDPPGL
jgi:hypothetical protein